jgi:hypothetical protein
MMLRLRSRRLEWARQDGHPGVLDRTRHLWVGHVLVDEDATDEGGVCQ